MRHPFALAGLAIDAIGVLAGCSSGPEPGPLFDNEGGRPITCLAHQPEEPGDRYTDRELRNTGEVLTMLRYYTAHGTKPYCDGAVATEADRAWAQVYLDLGGTPDRVAGILR